MRRLYSFLKIIFILVLFSLSFLVNGQTPDAAGIVYVTPNGTGDGSSWGDATANLQAAINAGGVQKVFVATGNYKSSGGGFVMKNDVEIYGGFNPGNGITTLAHNRILPNKGMGDGSVLDGENTRPVMQNEHLNQSAVLDGFTLMNGSGHGMYNYFASPTLRNLLMRNNHSTIFGGAMYNDASSSPTITDVVIRDNSGNMAGGIYNTGGSSPVIRNAVFKNNSALNSLGAVIFSSSPVYANALPVIINTQITENQTNYSISQTGTGGNGGNTTLINVTIANNRTQVFYTTGGGMITVNNSIVWGTLPAGGYTAQHSFLEGSTSTENGNIAASGITIDDMFTNPSGSDYTLKRTSPVLNKGNNALFTGLDGNSKDLAGNPRLVGTTIDLGAYEYPLSILPDPNGIVYVKQVASGSATGNTWDDATSDLHNAIHTEGVQKVFVATGTYPVGDHSFIMKNGVEIYGGFNPGSGITHLGHNRILPDASNPASGSVLNGQGARPVIWNVFNSGTALNTTAVLDGFSVANGGNYANGAGIRNVYASPTLNNLVIRDNTASAAGGGMYNSNSSPVITNTVFKGNSVASASGHVYGGAIYNTQSSAPVITNVSIVANLVRTSAPGTENGAGIFNDGSSPKIYNSIIWNNMKQMTGEPTGADIQNSGGGAVTLKNSITQNYTTGVATDDNKVNVNPLFVNQNNGNYTLQPTSPAINAGSNAWFAGLGSSTKDLAGNLRVYNLANDGVIDMGAYESSYNTPVIPDAAGIIYVRNGFTGDGSSWSNAIGLLQDAINAPGVRKVFVATGNYDAPASGSFRMKNGVEIYGGFDPDNGIRTLADTRILPTEAIGGSVLNGQNLRGVIRNDYTSSNRLDNSAVLDGFTITNGTTPGNTFGAGVLNVFASPALGNLVIKNNTLAAGGGAGMANVNASPVVSNVIITGNEALRGGGMYNIDNSTPTLTDVTISHNKATSTTQFGGGGMFNQQSSPTLTRVTITHNTAGNAGGGIYNISSAHIGVNNSIIENNSAPYGGGLYNNGSESQFTGVIFRGNSATMATTGSGGGAIFNQNSGLLLTNVAITGNSTNFQGGGFRNLSGNPVLTNVTFVNNTAVNTASTAIDIAGGAPDLYNTLVFGTVTGNYTARHSLIQGNTDFTNGNIDASAITPVNVFTNPANGDYTLPACSPAVNAGSNSLFPGLDISKVDLAGNARVYDFANGKAIDMGAYEFQGVPADYSAMTLENSTVVYNGTPHAITVQNILQGASVSYAITDANNQTSQGNAATLAGTYKVTATITPAGNCLPIKRTATLKINKAAAVITAVQTQKHVYDGTVKNVAATLNHTETLLTYSPQQGYAATGTHPVIISAAETDNYLKAADTVTLVIEKANLSGIAFRDSTVTYDGTPKSLAVSGLPADATVTYLNNGKINAGTYIVTATVLRPQYQDTVLSATLKINKAVAVITAVQTQKHVYDGIVKNVTATLNHTETALTYSPQKGYAAVGTYPIIISAAETGNYLKAADTVNLVIETAGVAGVTLRDSTFTYDGTPKSLAVSGLPADATVTYTGNAKTNAGIYTVTALIRIPNYNDVNLSATLTIRKAAAVITAAPTQKHVYDGTAKNITAALNHAEIPLTYSPQQGYTDAGTYAIVISAAETANYLAASNTVNLVIEKASLSGITFMDATFTYDGTPKSLAVSGLPAGATVTYSNNGKTDAGSYKVTATVSRQQYQDSLLSATLTIRKAAAVITAAAEQTHIADGALKNVVASLNHREATLSYSPQQGYAQPGNYEITVSAPESKNYLAASRKVKLMINKATFQGVGFSDGQFTYNGTPHFIYVWGAPEGTRISYSGNGQTNAGTYQVKALIQKENYHDLELSANLLIHKAQAYISTDAFQSHVYDGSVKYVQAGLNHWETSLGYHPQQGYIDAGSYQVTVTAGETPNYYSTSASVYLFIDKARFQGVSLPGSEFIYNGSPHSLAVSGAPEGAQITYTGNNPVNAGTYKVTALVQMKNYYDLELEAELIIHKAPQEISFEEIGIKHLENDTDFQLEGSSSSGLPVSYSYTYTAEEPPATVTAEGWVELHTSGYVSITAHQPGNENYLPAEPVTRQLKINSSDATLHRITIGGKVFETPDPEIYYLIDCADETDQIPVQLKTEVGADVVPGRSLVIDIPQPGIYKQTVVITSQDSTNTLTYHITVEKRFKFEDIGVQKFNNLFLINNNPETNGGYEFLEYEWYKNGELISSGQYYSAGSQASDRLDQGGVYSVRMKTRAGEWLSTCSFGFQPDQSFTLGISPNPVVTGSTLKVKVNDPGEAKVRILTLTGVQVMELFLKESPAEVKLPAELSAGTYILHYDNGRHRKSLPFVLEK